MTNEYCISFDDVLSASKRIEGKAHKTPVLTSTFIDNLSSRSFFFKVEAMQRTGSFKFRGATNAVLSLLESKVGGASSPLRVVTHSSGNHAAALSLAARIGSSIRSSGDVEATIVMPRNAPPIKKKAVKGYNGKIVLVDNTNEAREEMADRLVKEMGATFIHPSEDPRVIAGQGTVCLEMVHQVRELLQKEKKLPSYCCDLDAVIIPVGGGGLASGNVICLRGMLGDKIKIILAEPKELDDAKRSKEAGILLGHDKNNKLNSVADGLKTTLGPNTWPIVRDLVDDIITVSEEDILKATKLIWEKLKICIEPSAGVGVAVAIGEEFARKFPVADGIHKVGVILCGGNVDILKISGMMSQLK